MALSEAAKEAVYLRSFLAEIVNEICVTTILSDNQSAGQMARNAVYHERTKHIDIRHHFVRDTIRRNEISVDYIPTTEMPADILTKGLSAQRHYDLIPNFGFVKCASR